MTIEAVTKQGMVKNIEHINKNLSYVTLVSHEDSNSKEPRMPFHGMLNQEIYGGKEVIITNGVFPGDETEPETPYSHIKIINQYLKN